MRSFISYRRDDSRSITERIYDRLVAHFGKEAFFKDVDSILMGSDFRQKLEEAVSTCDTLLAIIGEHWLSIEDPHGGRRIDNNDDFVRIEIETALQRRFKVIPILVNDAKMPQSSELPSSLQKLAFCQATVIRHDPDFHRDVDRLIKVLTEPVIISLVDQTEATESNKLLSSLREEDMYNYFTKTVERDPLNIDAFLKRGQISYIWARQGGEGYRQAIQDFQKVLGINNKIADPHFGLGTVYYDLAIFDIIKRDRFRIHKKGKIRLNKATQLLEMKSPIIELFIDNQTRVILGIALDEFQTGKQLEQSFIQDRHATHVMFSPRDIDSRIHSIRVLFGYEPLTAPDEAMLSIFSMFYSRIKGVEALFEPVN
jgi:hypothetical protein